MTVALSRLPGVFSFRGGDQGFAAGVGIRGSAKGSRNSFQPIPKSAFQKPCCKGVPKSTVPQHAQRFFPVSSNISFWNKPDRMTRIAIGLTNCVIATMSMPSLHRHALVVKILKIKNV